jgi:phage-related protein
MKNKVLNLGVFFTSLLLISTVTAVPQINCKPVVNAIDKVEKNIDSINTELSNFIDKSVFPNGMIDFIKQINLFIIQIINNLIDLIRDLIGLVNLIDYLIYIINVLVTMILDLINMFFDLFNPSNNILN